MSAPPGLAPLPVPALVGAVPAVVAIVEPAVPVPAVGSGSIAAVPALAPDRSTPGNTASGTGGDGYMLIVIKSDGTMTMSPVSPNMADEMMKHAKPASAGMVLEHKGKIYMVEDWKMSNGKMASNFWSYSQNH